MTFDDYYKGLHAECGTALANLLSGNLATTQANLHIFLSDLDLWIAALSSNREVILLQKSSLEFHSAMLATNLGQYRAGVGALRSCLELSLTAVEHSAHAYYHELWRAGSRDITWASLVDDNSGVLSDSFCRAFFPELVDEVKHISSLARAVYRECSEYLHGNPLKDAEIPPKPVYSAAALDKWQELASSIRYVVVFALVMRYANELAVDGRASIETSVLDELGHLKPVASLFAARRE